MLKAVFQSLKAKLVIAIGAIFTLTISALMIVSYQSQKMSLLKSSQDALQKDYHSVVEKIGQTTAKAYALAELVANMPEVQAALAARDREALQALTLPFYQASRERIHIKQFQFHLPPATSFLRLHKLKKFGDDLSSARPTIVKTNQTQNPVLGLDRGPYGIGIRGLAPIFHNGNHVGSVEFGVSLNDALLKPLKDDYGINAAVLLENNQKLSVLASTAGSMDVAPSCNSMLKNVLDTSNLSRCVTEENGRHFMILGGPMLDYAGKTEGVIMVKMDTTEQLQSIHRLTWIYLAVGTLIIALTVGFCYWFIGNYLIRRVKHIKMVLAQASKGDLTHRIRIKASDEMGLLGRDINTFLDNVSAIVKNMQNRSDALNTLSESLNGVAQNMLIKMQDANGNAVAINTETRSMSDNLNSTAAAVEETSTNVDLIAQSAEELASTIRDILKNTEHANTISREAVDRSEAASSLIQALGTAANEIGNVTETIEEISEQTNLLALNATIEAARAGEAGKGFAVVANEIKELAKQTAIATGDIRQKIDAIRSSTENAVEGIGSIAGIIKNVSDNVTSITGAVEKQARTTDEISHSVSQASQGVREVTENISKNSVAASTIADNMSLLSQATSEIETESQEVTDSAEKSITMAQSMRGAVEYYRISEP